MTATALNVVASSNADLLDQVHTFLTTNADLVTAGEEWVSEHYVAGQEFIIKGVGLGGTDEIYIGWRVIDFVGSDVYNIEIRSFGGYVNGNTWDNQPFASPNEIVLCSYNQNFNYWLVANGRRFIVVEKISTTYLSCYCGLFLPYATPTQYPYPVFIGASSTVNTTRWSSSTNKTHAAHPITTGSGQNIISSGYINTNVGWVLCSSRSATTGNTSSGTSRPYIIPFNTETDRVRIRDDVDGGYTAFSSILVDPVNGSIMGELEGYSWVSGFQQTAESIITIDGNPWLVVEDALENDIQDYYAVRLL